MGALLALAACAGSGSVAQPRSLSPIRVAVGEDDRYRCFVDASSQHAFTAYGIDARIVHAAPGSVIDLLQANAVDIGAVDVSSALFAAPADPDLRLVAVDVSSNDLVKLWARAGAPDQPEAGTLGVIAGGPEDAASAHLMAARPGLRASSVSGSALAGAFKSGTVDYAFASTGAADLAAAGARVVVPSDHFGFSYQQGLVARASWLATRASDVRHLTEALAAGCRKDELVRSQALQATLTLAVRAPSNANIDNYTIELARHALTSGQAAAIVNALVRQDLVSDPNTLRPGCDCQLLPSPTPP